MSTCGSLNSFSFQISLYVARPQIVERVRSLAHTPAQHRTYPSASVRWSWTRIKMPTVKKTWQRIICAMFAPFSLIHLHATSLSCIIHSYANSIVRVWNKRNCRRHHGHTHSHRRRWLSVVPMNSDDKNIFALVFCEWHECGVSMAHTQSDLSSSSPASSHSQFTSSDTEYTKRQTQHKLACLTSSIISISTISRECFGFSQCLCEPKTRNSARALAAATHTLMTSDNRWQRK